MCAAKAFKPKEMTAQQKRHHKFFNMQFLNEKIPANFKIVGLDLGKFTTGFTVLDCETHGEEIVAHLEEFGVIESKTNWTSQKSVNEFFMKVKELFERVKPDVVAYEYIAVATSVTGFKALAKQESAMQIALNQVFPEETPLLVPVTVMAAKKIGLAGKDRDIPRAKALAKKLRPNWNPKPLKDIKKENAKWEKYCIMVATEDRYGVSFIDDNICDSFLVANAALYLARYLYEAQNRNLLEEYIDKGYLAFDKLKWAKDNDQCGFEVAMAICSNSFIIKENDQLANSKIVSELKRMYHVVLDESDSEVSGDGDAED